MPRVHATFALQQARQKVYQVASQVWQLPQFEIPWEVRYILTELEKGQNQYRFFLKKNAHDKEIHEFVVLQGKIGKYWVIESIKTKTLEVYKMNTYDSVDLETLLGANGDLDFLEDNSVVLEALRAGEKFYVYDRQPEWAIVCANNAWTFLVVTETGKVIPYRHFEMLAGKFFLNQGELPELEGEAQYDWFSYFHQDAEVSWEELEAWLRKEFGDQFISVQRLYEWERAAFWASLKKAS